MKVAVCIEKIDEKNRIQEKEKSFLTDYSYLKNYNLRIFHKVDEQLIKDDVPDIFFIDIDLYPNSTDKDKDKNLKNAINILKRIDKKIKIVLLTNRTTDDLCYVRNLNADDYLPITFSKWINESDFTEYIDILRNLSGINSNDHIRLLNLTWFKQRNYVESSPFDGNKSPFAHAIGNMLEDVAFYYLNCISGFIAYKGKQSKHCQIDLIVRNESTDPFFMKCGRFILVECKNRNSKTAAESLYTLIGHALTSFDNVKVVLIFDVNGMTESAKLNNIKLALGNLTILDISFEQLRNLLFDGSDKMQNPEKLVERFKEMYTKAVFDIKGIVTDS